MRIRHFKSISFQPFNDVVELSQTNPVTASSALPEWYKKLPRFINNSDKPIKSLGAPDLKSCAPFRDAMIAGYMILLPSDIEVSKSANGDIDIHWNPVLPFEIVTKRGDIFNSNSQGQGMHNPIGTSSIMFAWNALWGVRTDKKDSVLITHPLNRNDLPFVTTSGIVDSGYFDIAGNIPFFIKENFEGIIPKGTPIAQVIPFERQSWRSKILPVDFKHYKSLITLRDTYIWGFYSRFMRQPKDYK
jgi:hypothetical protein